MLYSGWVKVKEEMSTYDKVVRVLYCDSRKDVRGQKGLGGVFWIHLYCVFIPASLEGGKTWETANQSRFTHAHLPRLPTPIIGALGQVKPSSQCQNTWDFPSSVIVMLHLQLRWWLHFKINQYNLTKRYSNQHFRWQQAGSKLGILNGWLMLQKLWAQVLLVQTIRSTDFKKHARYGNKHLELMSSPYLLLPFHCVSGETQQSSFTSWFKRFSHQWE